MVALWQLIAGYYHYKRQWTKEISSSFDSRTKFEKLFNCIKKNFEKNQECFLFPFI